MGEWVSGPYFNWSAVRPLTHSLIHPFRLQWAWRGWAAKYLDVSCMFLYRLQSFGRCEWIDFWFFMFFLFRFFYATENCFQGRIWSFWALTDKLCSYVFFSSPEKDNDHYMPDHFGGGVSVGVRGDIRDRLINRQYGVCFLVPEFYPLHHQIIQKRNEKREWGGGGEEKRETFYFLADQKTTQLEWFVPVWSVCVPVCVLRVLGITRLFLVPRSSFLLVFCSVFVPFLRDFLRWNGPRQ